MARTLKLSGTGRSATGGSDSVVVRNLEGLVAVHCMQDVITAVLQELTYEFVVLRKIGFSRFKPAAE